MLGVLTWAVVILCAVALAVVLWLRRALGAYRTSVEGVLQGIVRLRKMAGKSPRLEPLSPHSPDVVPLERAVPDLESADLRPAGDFIELDEQGSPAGNERWFVAGNGVLFGWFGVTPAGPVMLLVSEVPGHGFVTTLRAPHAPSTATPPTVVQQRLEWDEGLEAALERHLGAVARMGRPAAIGNLDAAFGSMAALRAHVAEWRAAQDPNELLEADVRKILGDKFDQMSEMVGLVRLAEQLEREH
jgi:hypothetical protein